jgi:hypothetical protein
MKYLTTKIIRNISFRVKYPPPIIISSKHLTIQTSIKNSGQHASQSTQQNNVEQTVEKQTTVEYPDVEYDILLYYLQTEDKK